MRAILAIIGAGICFSSASADMISEEVNYRACLSHFSDWQTSRYRHAIPSEWAGCPPVMEAHRERIRTWVHPSAADNAEIRHRALPTSVPVAVATTVATPSPSQSPAVP